ncbi:MAG: ATP-binding protein [Clostridia bacterium]|nr:ATP-binding protein [Clostridia bacterium]
MGINENMRRHYKLLRESAAANLREREQRVRESCPEALDIDRQCMEVVNKYTRPIAGARGEEREAIRAARDAELGALKARKVELLETHGFDAGYLQMQYCCPKCADTGYFKGEPCECLRRLLLLGRYSEARLEPAHTFDAFDMELFQDGRVRRQMERIYAFARDYADRFPYNTPRNVVLQGAVGVGKTFLCGCIGNRILERGHSVVRVTAYSMVNAVLHSIRNNVSAPSYTEPDLLILDDLGVEPSIPNVTAEKLFCVLDERIETGKATLIATNLTSKHISELYGERIFSRLTSPKLTTFIIIEGKDVRAGR